MCKSGASEATVFAVSAVLWQYGVGCHLAHFFQSLLQLSETMGDSEGSKGSIKTEKTLPAVILCMLSSLPSTAHNLQ